MDAKEYRERYHRVIARYVRCRRYAAVGRFRRYFTRPGIYSVSSLYYSR